MTIPDITSHFAYNEWANKRTIGAIETLTPQQLTKDLASSFPSILHTAAHIVSAEWIWLTRWTGGAVARRPEWVSAPSLPDVRARLAAVEAARAAFLETFTDADLDRHITYTGFDGKTFTQPFLPMFMHVVNHSTYHRGQIAGMMRQLGATPIGTDLMAYARQINPS